MLSLCLSFCLSVALNWSGIGSLRDWLRAALGRLSQRRRLHASAGTAVTGWVDRNFSQEGRLATGSPAGWPPLARATLAARRRRGLGTRPLQATGRLRAGTRAQVTASGVVIDNPVPYAARHQLGEGVPARPFFPTRAQSGRIVQPVVDAFVRNALARGAGSGETTR